MNYQWYPGHMTKARRQMQEDLKLIDLMIELVDARVPAASRNPDIDELGKNKARLILLNPISLGIPSSHQVKGIFCCEGQFPFRSRHESDQQRRTGGLQRENRARPQTRHPEPSGPRDGCRYSERRKIDIYQCVCRACAKTGNKPGVTKGKQWIRLSKQLELLDTPGILWPKFEDQQVGLHLAMIGSINDEILNVEELALSVIDYLTAEYLGTLEKRFGFEGVTDRVEILGEIARVRGCLKKGNELDYEKAARLLMDDFRSGKLGRITLEKPE